MFTFGLPRKTPRPRGFPSKDAGEKRAMPARGSHVAGINALLPRAFVQDHPGCAELVSELGKAEGKKVSCMGMKIWPPSESSA